jgi:hypothetical protein
VRKAQRCPADSTTCSEEEKISTLRNVHLLR